MLDLSDPAAELTTLIDDFDSIADLVCALGSTFYLVTDYQAERKRVVSFAAGITGQVRTGPRSSARRPDTLLAGYFFGGRFVLHYLRNAYSVLRVHAADGSFIREIELPGYMLGRRCLQGQRGHRGPRGRRSHAFRAHLVRRVGVAVVASARDRGDDPDQAVLGGPSTRPTMWSSRSRSPRPTERR